jgi:hypothetical protein
MQARGEDGKPRSVGYNSGNQQTMCWGKALADGQWHHVATTFDAATSNIALYVNYKLMVSKQVSDPLEISSSVEMLRMGGANFPSAGYTNLIDEVRYTSGVLSSNQFLRWVSEKQVPEQPELSIDATGEFVVIGASNLTTYATSILQVREDLVLGNWSNLCESTGTSSTNWVVAVPEDDRQGFYRIETQY